MEPERFARQIRQLKALGYRGISLDEFMDALESGRAPSGRCVVITFDDGYADNFENALPVLRENGFTATVYVAASFIGRRIRFDHTVDPLGDLLMSEEQIREWTRAGMHVESHGLSHGNLAKMTEAEVRRELIESRAILEPITGKAVRHFSYPFGGFHRRMLDWVAEAGYRSATSTLRGKTHALDERFCLCRLPVHHERGMFRFWQYLWLKSYARSKKKQRDILSLP